MHLVVLENKTHHLPVYYMVVSNAENNSTQIIIKTTLNCYTIIQLSALRLAFNFGRWGMKPPTPNPPPPNPSRKLPNDLTQQLEHKN